MRWSCVLWVAIFVRGSTRNRETLWLQNSLVLFFFSLLAVNSPVKPDVYSRVGRGTGLHCHCQEYNFCSSTKKISRMWPNHILPQSLILMCGQNSKSGITATKESPGQRMKPTNLIATGVNFSAPTEVSLSLFPTIACFSRRNSKFFQSFSSPSAPAHEFLCPDVLDRIALSIFKELLNKRTVVKSSRLKNEKQNEIKIKVQFGKLTKLYFVFDFVPFFVS